MYNISICLSLLLVCASLWGQNVSEPEKVSISGVVLDLSEKQPIPGANIYWLADLVGTTTDADGKFTLEISGKLPAMLVVSYVGFASDTLRITSAKKSINVLLKPSLSITEVEISENKNVFEMSATSKLNAETINRGVLRKAACCNLSESFETTASVDVVLNDAVTGARTIQMLGLDGAYVQTLFEGVPFTRGLANVFGFDQIPGPWINAIELTKGTGTVAYGYESMTGQINLEFLPARGDELLHADVFANNQGRYETNAIWNTEVSKRWSTAIFAGAYIQDREMDNNTDGFLDMPLRQGYKLMNRWNYFTDFFRTDLIAKYTTEERTSGQVGFDQADKFDPSGLYGFGMDSDQIEVLGKLTWLSRGNDQRRFDMSGIYTYTDLEAFFGINPYVGEQQTARLNALVASKFSEFSDHYISGGVHYLFDSYQESFADSAFSRVERVPGVFVEYTYERPRYTAIFGGRADFHNLFGTQLSPRVHMKYNFKPLTSLRGTVGRGFRTPNAFADQLGLLASSREVRVLENPEAETSWNAGLSFLHKFHLFGRDAFWNVDYYYTDFQNKLIVDRDFDAGQLLFYNLKGRAFAHSFQTDFQAQLLPGLGFKASYKYQDVYSDMIAGRLRNPMIPRHRFLLNAGYTTADGKWTFDATANYYGQARLPATSSEPGINRPGTRSEPFFLVNLQVTRIFKSFEIYTGVENINNFIQANAIIDPENPFGPDFDATVIYSPLNGRNFYVGARLNLNTQKK